MDPYLEGSLWTTVHSELSSAIARQLSPKVRPKYLALPTERFVFAEPESVAIAAVYPDVGLAGTKGTRPRSEIRDGSAEPAPVAPVQIATVIPDSIPHLTVEIRDVKSRQLVTAIEVLSPTNKSGDGRVEYLRKRRAILVSSAHLLEIDFLRAGTRVPMQEPLPPAPYYVFLSRAERRPLTDVWPIRLRGPLPAVPVPLLQGDADVTLDLQAALDAVYDGLGLDLAVDYAQPPDQPLATADAEWARTLLGKG